MAEPHSKFDCMPVPLADDCTIGRWLYHWQLTVSLLVDGTIGSWLYHWQLIVSLLVDGAIGNHW